MSEQLPFQTIGKVCGPNPGFVRNLWLIDARHVRHIPDPFYLQGSHSLLVPSRMISFSSGALVYKMKFRNKECTWDEGPARGEAGAKFTQSIQFPLLQVSQENTKWLFDNINTQWIAFFKDHLGNIRIIGTPGLPVELNYRSGLNSDNSSTISLFAESRHPAYFTDAMPVYVRVFDAGFSENFA